MSTLIRAGLLSSFLAVGFLAPAVSADSTVAAPAPAAESPEQVVMNVSRGLSEGRPYVAWDALPDSYQQDLTGVVHAFAEKVDPELWNKGFTIVRKAGGMLRNQKDNILAMPKFRQSPGFDAEQVSREWNLVVAPFMTIAESDIANVETLKTLDVRDFLSTTGVQFMQDLVKISEFAEEDNQLAALGRTKATLVSHDGDTAVVKVEQPGQGTHTETFVLVEGKWIPAEMAKDWAEGLAEAHEGIARMSPETFESVKPKVMSMLTLAETTIDQLDKAESAQQFEQTLQMGMMQAFGGMMELAQAMESDDRP